MNFFETTTTNIDISTLKKTNNIICLVRDISFDLILNYYQIKRNINKHLFFVFKKTYELHVSDTSQDIFTTIEIIKALYYCNKF